MKEFNDSELAKKLIGQLFYDAKNLKEFKIMEVCGTHTMAIGKTGIRRALPSNIKLVSGPGCPVCVTPASYIDNAVKLARAEKMVIYSFGDLIRVPGYEISLEEARGEGIDVRIITSLSELLNEKKRALFLAVGFETTIAPILSIADWIIKNKIENIFLYTSFKTVPNTLLLLEQDKNLLLDGFLLPGHVSSIIGASAYEKIKIPGVISGFDLVDILDSIRLIMKASSSIGEKVINNYKRVVSDQGNRKAKAFFEEYLEPSDQLWRGLGNLPGCSLKFKKQFASLDAEKLFDLPELKDPQFSKCSCGEILKGKINPFQCPSFAKGCTPTHPLGPCMVSSEGSCASYYKYERVHDEN